MLSRVAIVCSTLIVCVLSNPAAQQAYQPQYLGGQVIAQPQTYQPQYVTRPKPVFEPSNKPAGLQYYSSQRDQPIQPVILASNVDRQVQRVAQSAGPAYLNNVLAAQQQGQTQQVLATAQRKQTSQTLNSRPVAAEENYPVQYVQRQAAQPQYQQEYRPQAQAQYRGQGQQQRRPLGERTEDEQDYDPNPSYQFGFDVKDDLYTNYQNRKEQRDGNKITGSYSVVDSDGFIRTVQYTADPKEGFKAEVIRQPTDIVVKIPKPDPRFQNVQPQPQQQQYAQERPSYRQEVQQQSPYRYQ